MIYEGGNIADITTENILNIEESPEGTLITFRVHGSEGTRTYIFRGAGIGEISEAVAGFAELL